MKVLIIDNYDSFVFNLYQEMGAILGEGHTLWVRRNDALSCSEIAALEPDRIVISPGPGSPDDRAYFGVCAEVLTQLSPQIPTLGVCLGLQGIVHVFGGQIVRASLPVHGKTSPILHDERGVFRNLPQKIAVMRYHSLCAARPLPSCLRLTAVVDQGRGFDDPEAIIMGVRHREYPIEGVQFHPESFATEGRRTLLSNFLFQDHAH